MTVDATIYRDTDAVIEVDVTDGNGNAVDMSGAIISYRVGDRFVPATTSLDAIAGQVVNGPAGKIQAVLGEDHLDALASTQYTHQFYVELATGEKGVVVDGVLTVKSTVPA